MIIKCFEILKWKVINMFLISFWVFFLQFSLKASHIAGKLFLLHK